MSYDQSIEFVRIVWVDAAGIRRCRVVTRSRYDEGRLSVGIACVCLFLPAYGDESPPDAATSSVGEMRLVPSAPLRPLPWNPQDSIVLSRMHTEEGEPFPLCPVHALHAALRHLENETGVSQLNVGFESEFTLFHKPSHDDLRSAGAPLIPVDTTVYCQTLGFDSISEVLREICTGLEKLGQYVEQVHGESAHGQYEIVTRYQDAVSSAESLILRKETISAVANKHGMIASFLPKIVENQAGNGCHCHFSFSDNAMTDSECAYSLSALGEAFAAGILAHLPSLMIFTAGSPNSFHRFVPGAWSGAFQCWGVNNKEAPLRLVGLPGDPSSINFELKTFDNTANPYLGLTAMIAAGLLGIRNGLNLPDPMQINPGDLSKEEAAVSCPRLPCSLDEALNCFEADKEFRGILDEIIGDEAFTRAYVAMKRKEAENVDLYRGIDFIGRY